MKKITILFVIIFSFLFSTTSWGEWTLVQESVGGNKWYYDKDRVRKNGKSLYLWELQDFIKPTKSGVFSFTIYVQLDCSIFRFKRLKIQSYNKSMGEGKMTLDLTPEGKRGEWKYPPPKSYYKIIYNKICSEYQ